MPLQLPQRRPRFDSWKFTIFSLFFSYLWIITAVPLPWPLWIFRMGALQAQNGRSSSQSSLFQLGRFINYCMSFLCLDWGIEGFKRLVKTKEHVAEKQGRLSRNCRLP